MVFGGGWDQEDKRGIEQYLLSYIYSNTVYQLFRDGIPVEQTDQYREMVQFVNRGQVNKWQARGCTNEADIKRYFDGLQDIFEAIRDVGYRSQEELGSPRWIDEIKVFVDRNGEFHKQQAAGHHRLAMARILGVPEVPVVVLGVHRDWALRVQRATGLDVLTSVDLELRNRSTRARVGRETKLEG